MSLRIVPFKLHFLSVRRCKSCNSVISRGIGPLILGCSAMPKNVNFFRAEMFGDTNPDKRPLCRSRDVNLFSANSSSGIGPLNLLCDNLKSTSSERSDICRGMVPERLLVPTYSVVNFESLNRLCGNAPVKKVVSFRCRVSRLGTNSNSTA